jgi:hypothetical protein
MIWIGHGGVKASVVQVLLPLGIVASKWLLLRWVAVATLPILIASVHIIILNNY